MADLSSSVITEELLKYVASRPEVGSGPRIYKGGIPIGKMDPASGFSYHALPPTDGFDGCAILDLDHVVGVGYAAGQVAFEIETAKGRELPIYLGIDISTDGLTIEDIWTRICEVNENLEILACFIVIQEG